MKGLIILLVLILSACSTVPEVEEEPHLCKPDLDALIVELADRQEQNLEIKWLQYLSLYPDADIYRDGNTLCEAVCWKLHKQTDLPHCEFKPKVCAREA